MTKKSATISKPVTEENLKSHLTKLKQELDVRFDILEKSLRVDFKLSILNLEQRIDGRFKLLDEKFTKKFDQVLTRLDPVMAEIENAREDRVLAVHQTSQLRTRVDNHEKRIARLEHP